jgi:hypothetical protein
MVKEDGVRWGNELARDHMSFRFFYRILKPVM